MQDCYHRRWVTLPISVLAVAAVCMPGGAASAQNAPAGAAVVARVLAPAEKIKLLEEELAKESEKRIHLEEQDALRSRENGQLVDTLKSAQKERASLETRLAESRDRESLLQRTNDRLREETERVTVSVRYAMPIIAGAVIIMLAMIVWLLLFLRQVAARVHGQRTISEMHELEGRLIHTNDLLAAELKRSQALRNRLTELGVVD